MPRKRGGKTIFSSQEAAEIIFMNSESKGEDVDLGEDICGDSDFDTGSEYEAEEEEDIESSDEEVSFTYNKKAKKVNNV